MTDFAAGPRNWLKEYWRRLTGSGLVLLAVVAALTRVEWLAKLVDAKLLDTPAASPSQAAWWLAWCSILLGAFALTSLALARLAFSWLSDAKRFQVANLAYENAIRESFRIVNKLYPVPDRPPCKVLKAHYVIAVDKNGDGWVRQEQQIIAIPDHPLHFWQMFMGVEAEAKEATTLEDIDFSAEDLGGTDIAYLLIKSEPRRKQIALFYLPRITADEKKPRKIRTSYRWRGLMRQLTQKGKEDWTWTMPARGDISEFEFKFFYHPDLGRITCSHVSPHLEPVPKLASIQSEQGWPGWSFKARDVPAEGTQYTFSFRKAGRGEAQAPGP